MSKVFYIPNEEISSFGSYANAALAVFKELEKQGFDSYYSEDSTGLGLKVHFGEEGNKTFIKPENYAPIIDYTESKGANPDFIETNVLYRGRRMKRDDHIALAHAHGFKRIPVKIMDGEIGEEYTEIKIDKKHFKTCSIASGFEEYSHILVLSHFKGHLLAGFGGALKQLAMGFASRGGKLAQHVNSAPLTMGDKCVFCGKCVKGCPASALEIKDDKINLYTDKCIGCAACVAICPQGVFRIDWMGSRVEDFRERLGEYALGAAYTKARKAYISYGMDITKYCDCDGSVMKPIVDDIGIFGSLDPVSIDSACMDITDKKAGKPIFQGRDYIDYCDSLGLGSKDYELVRISNKNQ